MESCEICGKNQNSLTKISTAGTNVSVCDKCTKHGSRIENNINEHPPHRPLEEQKEFDLNSNYGTIIYEKRKEKGYTFQELSSITGISMSLIRSYEQEYNEPPPRHIEKIENALNIEHDRIVMNPDD